MNSIEKSEGYSISDKILFLINVSKNEVFLINPEISPLPEKIRNKLEMDYCGYFHSECSYDPLEIKISQDIQYKTRFLDLFIKSPSLKERSDSWFKVVNWNYELNPEILVEGNFNDSGILENYKDFELVYSSEGDCLFLKKDTPQYEMMVTNSMDKLIFQTSSKTSKRKDGNLYLSPEGRKVYLGSYCFGKDFTPMQLYADPSKDYKSVEEILLDKARNSLISYQTSKETSDSFYTSALVRKTMMVDYGTYVEPLSAEFDFRSLWKIHCEEYVKNNKKPESKYSSCYHYTEIGSFFSIFLFSPIGSNINDNRKWITPEIKSLAEDIFKTEMRKKVVSLLELQPTELKKMSGVVKPKGLKSDRELKDYISHWAQYAYDVLKYSELLDYSSREGQFMYLLRDLFQIDLFELAERVISSVKAKIHSLEYDFSEYYSWNQRQIVLNRACGIPSNNLALNQISEVKNRVGAVLVSKQYKKIEELEFFNNYPHLKNIILKIYFEAIKNKGVGNISEVSVRLAGNKSNPTRIFTCSITLENIVDFCGGLENVLSNPELENDILDSKFTKIIIRTNNTRFELL